LNSQRKKETEAAGVIVTTNMENRWGFGGLARPGDTRKLEGVQRTAAQLREGSGPPNDETP
jgi:hypothetical protein